MTPLSGQASNSPQQEPTVEAGVDMLKRIESSRIFQWSMILIGRLLRVFSVLRLVSVVPELHSLINALLKTMMTEEHNAETEEQAHQERLELVKQLNLMQHKIDAMHTLLKEQQGRTG